jgi:hypothetical protein
MEDLDRLAHTAVEARKTAQRAREALMAAEEEGKASDVIKAARRSLRKAIRARDVADEALMEAEKTAGRPAVIAAESDALDAGIIAPAPRTKLRDDQRYINPAYDPRLDAIWHVYMWDGKTWQMVGEVRKKPNRRKPMTMSRLFAGIRNKFSIAKEVPIRLISKQDDSERTKRGLELASPERRKGNRQEEPLAIALATPGKRVAAPPPPRKPSPKAKVDIPAPKSKKTTTEAQNDPSGKARYAMWGAMHGRTYFLGTSSANRQTYAKLETQSRFPDHVGIKAVPITNLPYATRNEIRDGGLVAGVTEMEAP